MECLNCDEITNDLIDCTQCGSSYCDKCQPEWDYQGEICSHCSESNTVAALRDDAWTAKMRRWFSKKIPIPEQPALIYNPPYSVARHGAEWHMITTETSNLVAVFSDCSTADYVCLAANNHHQLSALMVTVYERIRAGDAWFRGDESDCNLWTQLKTLLK